MLPFLRADQDDARGHLCMRRYWSDLPPSGDRTMIDEHGTELIMSYALPSPDFRPDE
jgi:hypothetical protein